MPADTLDRARVASRMPRDLLAHATTRLHIDRYGLGHHKPGCPADIGSLGWVPGVIYRTYGNIQAEVLGYTVDGRVMIRRYDNGQVVAHRTSLHRTDKALCLSDLGERLQGDPR